MFIKAILLFFMSSSLFATENYSKTFQPSEVSEWFFGPATTKAERKKLSLNIGRIGIRVKPTLNCGKLNFAASISGGIEDLQQQMSTLATNLQSTLTGGGLALATICYMQKNICSHMRHLSAMLEKELKFQFDSCQAIDSFIDDQASSHQKSLRAKNIQSCMTKRKDQGSITALKECKAAAKSESRNLLAPFTDKVANSDQNVLKSVLKVIKKDGNYLLWSKLLGEVRLSTNGYYKPLFPNDMLRPDDLSHNVELASRNTSCDTRRLGDVLRGQSTTTSDIFSKHLNKIIIEKVPPKIVFDLDSLPPKELLMACQSLGDSLAQLALKSLTSEGRSDMAAALTNDGLPEDLKLFYENRASTTFEAIEARIAAKEVNPLKKTLSMIHKLAKSYRKINRHEASGISARRAMNNSNKNECIDQLSCERN